MDDYDPNAPPAPPILDAPVLVEPDYVVSRRAEYPPIEMFVDGVVKNDHLQIAEYITACLAVKAKYPKPEQ